MILSPWLNAKQAGEYIGKGRRFILNEVRTGRLRAARCGGRGEVLTRAEWLDEWVEDRAAPVAVSTGRRLRGAS